MYTGSFQLEEGVSAGLAAGTAADAEALQATCRAGVADGFQACCLGLHVAVFPVLRDVLLGVRCHGAGATRRARTVTRRRETLGAVHREAAEQRWDASDCIWSTLDHTLRPSETTFNKSAGRELLAESHEWSCHQAGRLVNCAGRATAPLRLHACHVGHVTSLSRAFALRWSFSKRSMCNHGIIVAATDRNE
jgi:hypothetical protein